MIMYKELEKYATGKTVDTPIEIPNGIAYLRQDEYSMPLGDLIEDYIAHRSKPFWKRKYYDKHLTRIYKNTLNLISIQQYL